jgi:hypothetical protein
VPPNRDDGQRRVHQIGAFRAELEALKAAGALPLTSTQEAELRSYHDDLLRRLAAEYDVDPSEHAAQLSRGMRLLSFFGAVALTAAVYSLVERYWGWLDLPQQATLLTAFPLMALVGVELSARRERTLYVASLFALVAYGTFWLAVVALSWTLNIPATPVFIWAGGAFGLALAIPYGFRVVLAAALVALPIAMAGSVFQAAGIPWSVALERFDLLTAAAFSMLVLAIPLGRIDAGFPAVTRLVALAMGLGGLLLLSTTAGASLMAVDDGIVEGMYQAAMFVMSIAILVLAIRHRWNETVNLVSVFLGLFLLVRFVDWFWDLLPRYVFFLGLAVLSFIWLFVLRRIRGRLVVPA